MRSIHVILSVLMAVMAKAEVPMDLDSPFSKTAAFSNTLGQQEVREVVAGEKKGGLVELRKADGTLIVVPEAKIVAIVPKLPNTGLKYTQAEASKAYLFLQKAQSQLLGMEEVSPAALKAWSNLAKQESNYETEAKKTKAAMLQNWFSKVTLEGDEVKNISLEEYIREGEKYLALAGEDRAAIQERLEKARQRLAMDFEKLEKIRLCPAWNNINPLIPLGAIGILALVTIWGLVNINNFVTAIKMAFMSLFASERSSRVLIFHSKSAVGIVLGSLLLYCVYLATRVEKIAKNENIGTGLTTNEKKALYLSLNTRYSWSKQASEAIKVSASNFLTYLFGKIENADPVEGFVMYDTPLFRFQAGNLILIQGLKIARLPLQLKLDITTGDGPFSFSQFKTNGLWLGRLPLGSFIGDYLANELAIVFDGWDGQVGINQTSKWQWDGKSQLLISCPEVAQRTAIASSSTDEKKKFRFKKELTATELAQIFADGYGEKYIGKYVDISGQIIAVSSGHRLGNSLASETLRRVLLKKGGNEAVSKLSPKTLEDEPDVFTLFTSAEDNDKIKLKCVIKEPEIFYLDARGDLYREGQNPDSADPLVRKGTEAHFKGGRIDSFEHGVIKLYDAKLQEASKESGSEPEIQPQLNSGQN